MATELIAGLGIFKTMFDLARGMKDISDATIRNSVAIDLQEKILAAQLQQSSLVQAVSDLEAQVASLKAWDAEKERYELRPMRSGDFAPLAYTLKEAMARDEPDHWLCPTCFHRGKKSILQGETRMPGRAVVFQCHECGAELYPHSPRNMSLAKR